MLLNSSSLLAQWFSGFTGPEKPEPVPLVKSLILFTSLLIPALPLAIVLHWLLSPLTDLVITLGAKVFYALASNDISCSLNERNFVFISPRPSFEASVSLRDITVNQPILWALILVSPGIRWLNRLRKVALGTGILLVSHIMFLICKVELTLVEAEHPLAGSSIVWVFIDDLFEITGKGFFPVAIWLLLSVNYMLGDIDRRNKTRIDRVGRNDPCYCGSGKKYKNCCMP